MTASTHCGFSLYTFPARQGDSNILIDASHRLTQDGPEESDRFEGRVKIVSPDEAEGTCESGDFCSPYAGNKQTLYFVVQFSKPATATGIWRGKELSSDNEAQGKSVGAFFRFSTAEQEPIGVKAGVSYVSVENARLNLKTEIPGWDFAGARAAARAEWNRRAFPRPSGRRPGKPAEGVLHCPLPLPDPPERVFRRERGVPLLHAPRGPDGGGRNPLFHFPPLVHLSRPFIPS